MKLNENPQYREFSSLTSAKGIFILITKSEPSTPETKQISHLSVSGFTS